MGKEDTSHGKIRVPEEGEAFADVQNPAQGGAVTSKELPIEKNLAEIAKLLEEHGRLVIVGETGSGKTLRTPHYLYENVVRKLEKEHGHKDGRCFVTVPRRILAERGAIGACALSGEKLGEKIGFRTANPHIGCYSPHDTKITYLTDGLLLKELLSGKFLSSPNVQDSILFIDEVHERNRNVEKILLLANYYLKQGKPFPKIVCMSATIDERPLCRTFSAPVVFVKGRPHEIVDLPISGDMVKDVLRQVELGRNVLIFDAGKREIAAIKDQILDRMDEMQCPGMGNVFLLHREQSPEEQARCFHSYSVPKIVSATPIAEAGITITDMDTVCITGWHRVRREHNGIEGLFKEMITFHNYMQQLGRIGRMKIGYALNYAGDLDALEEAPEPEFYRVNLAGDMLSIAKAGLSLTKLIEMAPHLYPKPIDPSKLERAENTLKDLDLIRVSESGHTVTITELGNRVSDLPVSVEVGVMIDRAIQQHERSKTNQQVLSVLPETLLAAACITAGGITERLKPGQKLVNAHWHKRYCINEITSDVLAQVRVFKGFAKDAEEAGFSVFDDESLRKIPERFFQLHGINQYRFFEAVDSLILIRKNLSFKDITVQDQEFFREINGALSQVNDHFAQGHRQWVYTFNGPKQVCIHSPSKKIQSKDNKERTLAFDSAIDTERLSGQNVIVGIPFTIQKTDGGEVDLMRFAVAVSRGIFPDMPSADEVLSPKVVKTQHENKQDRDRQRRRRRR